MLPFNELLKVLGKFNMNVSGNRSNEIAYREKLPVRTKNNTKRSLSSKPNNLKSG
jgi:hypothetical protein